MRRTPSPPTSPPEQKPSASDHAIRPEDFGEDFDFDGFGVNEAERVEGEPLVTIRELAICHRDGCDAAHERRLLFTTATLSDAEKHALDIVSGGEMGVYVFENAERIDIEIIEVDGTTITPETIIEDEATGSCYGRVEPSPDVDAYRYDL